MARIRRGDRAMALPTGSRRRFRLLTLAVGAAVATLGPGRPASAASPSLDVRVERNPIQGSLTNDLSVNLRVTLTDLASGQPPAPVYDLFTFATAGDERTIPFPCALDRANDPAAPLGVYSCTVIVDHGGLWVFEAAVNQKRVAPKEPIVRVAEGKATLQVNGSTTPVVGRKSGRGIKGSAREVLVLWAHSVAAALWFACVAALVALSVPGLRRRLSTFGLHRLEERFDLVVKGIWAATVLTIGSGTYLLLKQTAYKTPFSTSALTGVFALPYGRPYFLSLGAKLGLYALMVLASIPLIREAGRHLRSGSEADISEPSQMRAARGSGSDPWGPTTERATGARTLVVDAPAEAPAARPADPPLGATVDRSESFQVRLAAAIVAAGGIGIWMCVTLLKYFHELVEASRLR